MGVTVTFIQQMLCGIEGNEDINAIVAGVRQAEKLTRKSGFKSDFTAEGKRGIQLLLQTIEDEINRQNEQRES